MASSSGHVSDSATEQGSVTGLLTRLMDDAMALARNEIALAKAEARGALQDFKLSIGPFAIAAGVLLAGALTLVAALVLALAEVMRPIADGGERLRLRVQREERPLLDLLGF